jgi:hypothetical protein
MSLFNANGPVASGEDVFTIFLVRATSEMMPRLVEVNSVGRHSEVDIVSWVEFHSTPSALG